ncbi:MAG: NAD/NADP octopine/nopaline dehydrogenase family protein [Clostridia bacterium]|nr:NAD/NADP octopine/nopaline dehydrogenase family protein [Clostridia bacterium]
MEITIIGGGNIGTQFAVHSAEKGEKVTVYTSQPELYDGHLCIVDDDGHITHQGNIKLATKDPRIAFQSADFIMVTVPAMMIQSAADLVYTYGKKDAIIGVVPGNGGSECAFMECIKRGNTFFGIERVPAIARLVEKGKSVKSIGYRDELHIASFPKGKAKICAELISNIFEKKVTVIPNYLNLTMTPSNPILHTSRMYSLFHDWHEGVFYNSVPLFYEEWDDQSSELLFACDDEVQKICQKLPEFTLQYVKSLKTHYESPTVEKMTEKLSSIDAFKNIKTPMIKADKGYIPDLHSRYFTADFSYGLSIIRQIAQYADVLTPTIDMILEWYRTIAIEKDEFSYHKYGINNLNDLKQFYCN